MIAILKTVKAQSGWMGVVAPCANVRRLLETVAIVQDPAVRIFPDLAEAEGQLHGEG
jgi:hypothetical protein